MHSTKSRNYLLEVADSTFRVISPKLGENQKLVLKLPLTLASAAIWRYSVELTPASFGTTAAGVN